MRVYGSGIGSTYASQQKWIRRTQFSVQPIIFVANQARLVETSALGLVEAFFT